MTADLVRTARIYGAQLEEIEEMFEAEARRRELILTKLYSRLNHRIKLDIEDNEGNLKTQLRSRTNLNLEASEDPNRLFDGIRD